ncbi:MAG: hypothetical protein ACYS22_17560, partial [Planctomycetota bacterium]
MTYEGVIGIRDVTVAAKIGRGSAQTTIIGPSCDPPGPSIRIEKTVTTVDGDCLLAEDSLTVEVNQDVKY